MVCSLKFYSIFLVRPDTKLFSYHQASLLPEEHAANNIYIAGFSADKKKQFLQTNFWRLP